MPEIGINHTLKLYKLWLILGICLLAAIVYLSLTARPLDIISFAMSDKVGHLVAYFSLMAWFGQIYVTKNQHILLVIGFCTMGALLEGLQYLGGRRMFEYHDMMANIIGVSVGWLFTRYIVSGVLLKIDKKLVKAFSL